MESQSANYKVPAETKKKSTTINSWHEEGENPPNSYIKSCHKHTVQSALFSTVTNHIIREPPLGKNIYLLLTYLFSFICI